MTPVQARDTVCPVKCLLVLISVMLLGSCASVPSITEQRLRALYPPERPFAESRFATFGGISLHYRTWTPAGDTLGKVLLLHTTGASTVSYRLLGPELAAAGYAVLAVDLPGFGYSDRAPDFVHTAENRSGLLWTLVDRVDTEPNAFPPADTWVLLGHGMGGHVVTQMTLDRPSRVRGMVLVATEITGTIRPGRFTWFAPTRWILRSWLENALYTRAGVEELLTDAYGRRATDEEIDLYAAPLVRQGMPRAYVRYARTVGSMRFNLESIEVPVLVARGELDRQVRPDRVDAAATRLRDAQAVVIPGAGHLPMETHPVETGEALVRWMER